MPRQTSLNPHGTVPDPDGPLLPNDRMRIDWWDIARLTQPANAPKRYSRRDIEKAEAIIRRFGVRLPVLIEANGRVISTFVVVISARNLGHAQLPVMIVTDLSKIEIEQLSLANNNLYALGKYDRQLLGAMLTQIELEVPNIDFGTLGFEVPDADNAILAAKSAERSEIVPERERVPISVMGDIWLCGAHRIGCGNAGDAAWLAALMAAYRAAMVFTDYPYGCRVGGFVTSRAHHREFVQASGQESTEELFELFGTWCERLRECSTPGALVYLCIDWRSLGLLMKAATNIFGPLINLIVWSKQSSGMGSLYRSQHELILLHRVPGGEHRNNVELGRHGRNRSNVWSYPSAQGFARSGTEGDLLADHPTPKNKEMIADAMRDCTKRGDIVLDPFLGSGSTLIAAEKVGRVCVGSDLDPLYIDLAVRRWQAWTGQQARHAETGQTFDQITHQRADATQSQDNDDDRHHQ